MNLRRLKIKNRIFVVLLASLLISSSIVFQTSRFISQSVIEKYMYNRVILNQEKLDSAMNFLIDEVNMLSVRLLVNDRIYELLEDKQVSQLIKKQRLNAILDQMLINREVVEDINIITFDGEVFQFNNEGQANSPDPFLLKEIQHSNVPVWGGINKDQNGNAVILLGRKFRNFFTGQQLGYLVININERALYRTFENTVKDWGYSFILSDDHVILSHPNKEKVGEVVPQSEWSHHFIHDGFKETQYNGKSVILANHTIPTDFKKQGEQWKIVSVISDDHLFYTINQIKQYALIIQFIIVILAIVISFIASFKIIKPLKRLNKKLNKFGKGQSNTSLAESNSQDELWMLENSFNDMVIRINDLIERNNEAKDQQRKMELVALQAQINPHFIYNTLDAISWIAKIHKQQDIEKMTLALATFFRMSLHKGDKYISVQEEIEIVKSYTTIEKMRFPDRFTIHYNISPDIVKAKIMKIIIQPFVENAIKHGIAKKKGPGHITINGYRTSNDLRFEIIDTGIGFDKKMLNQSDFHSNYKGGGYGMRNVDERIKLEYGEGYGVQISSKIGHGTKVMITVKIIE
ncbi:cache domain-containing sensor histidine kinase [Metabacillus arenae]|uniref:Sensor histidine kinase n=1 Tax=Metabacillus arenae TaxID=2771434 RepID=A0A926S2S4_9BACI|nr:sensor histidine kinase [Metabacillus arenae]MBD1382279.1 sensor histidine kinase [Metabacillus arenae]